MRHGAWEYSNGSPTKEKKRKKGNNTRRKKCILKPLSMPSTKWFNDSISRIYLYLIFINKMYTWNDVWYLCAVRYFIISLYTQRNIIIYKPPFRKMSCLNTVCCRCIVRNYVIMSKFRNRNYAAIVLSTNRQKARTWKWKLLCPDPSHGVNYRFINLILFSYARLG